MTTPIKRNSTAANRYKVRWLTVADIEEVFSLSKRDGGEDFWEYDMFSEVVRYDPPGCLVACDPDTGGIVSFCCYFLAETAHRIVNLVVAREHRGEGIGTRLLATIERLDGTWQRESLSACVRESDLAAQLYLKRRGFRCVETFPDYYSDPSEDAYAFIRPAIVRGRR